MESCFQFWDFHMHIGWHGKWNPHSVFSRSLSWVVSWYHLNATKFKVFLALIISDIDFSQVGFIHFFYIVLFILFLLFIKHKGLRVRYALPRCMFAFLTFFFSRKVWLFNQFSATCESHALFTDPQILLFSNFFIKNGPHGTIYTFKNYFVTVFFSFQFSVVSKRTLRHLAAIWPKPCHLKHCRWESLMIHSSLLFLYHP